MVDGPGVAVYHFVEGTVRTRQARHGAVHQRRSAPELPGWRRACLEMVCPDQVVLEFMTLKWKCRPPCCRPAHQPRIARVPVGPDPRPEVLGLADVEEHCFARGHDAVDARFPRRGGMLDWHVLGPWQVAPGAPYGFPSWPKRMGSRATIGVCGAVGKQLTAHSTGLHPGFGVVGMEPPMVRPG